MSEKFSLMVCESDLGFISDNVYEDSKGCAVFLIDNNDAFKFICLRTILANKGYKILSIRFDNRMFKICSTTYPMKDYELNVIYKKYDSDVIVKQEEVVEKEVVEEGIDEEEDFLDGWRGM